LKHNNYHKLRLFWFVEKPILSKNVSQTEISKEEIRNIIKEELDEIIRSVFWEEAPVLIKDVLEKQIEKLYGQSQDDK